jgi:hypothetical protein
MLFCCKTEESPMTTAAEMSWDEIKALVAELAIQSKETDRKFQETDRPRPQVPGNRP